MNFPSHAKKLEKFETNKKTASLNALFMSHKKKQYG